MSLELMIAAGGSVVAIIACNVGLFSWLKADINVNRSEAAADRRDLLQIMREIREENKHFHGRVCNLEYSENQRKENK